MNSKEIYIVVFSTTREYGGPEEGGWWYNWTSIEQTQKVYGWKKALQCVREAKNDFPAPRYSIYSAANRGEPEYQIRVFSDPSEFEDLQSTEVPYYCQFYRKQ